MSEKTLPCFVCGKPLEPALGGVVNQPSEASVFTTNGNYGSTTFDPMDGTWLELNVCDRCLTLRSHFVLLGKQIAPRIPARPDPIYKEWVPDE